MELELRVEAMGYVFDVLAACTVKWGRVNGVVARYVSGVELDGVSVLGIYGDEGKRLLLDPDYQPLYDQVVMAHMLEHGGWRQRVVDGVLE